MLSKLEGVGLHWGLVAFYLAYYGFVGLYSPYMAPYLNGLGHSLTVVAWAMAMMPLMRIVGPFAWGWLADHTQERVRWLRLACWAVVLSMVALLLGAPHVWALLLCSVLLNFFASGLMPMADAHVMNHYQGDPVRYGRIRLFGSLGFMCAVLLFGFVAKRFGFVVYAPWLLLCVLGLLAATYTLPPVVRHPSLALLGDAAIKPVGWASVARLFAPVPMRLMWLASFFMVFAHGVFYAFFSLYLVEHGYSTQTVGVLWALGVAAEVLFFACQGRFFWRWALHTWLCVAYAVCALRFALTAWGVEYLGLLVAVQILHAITFAAHHSATMTWLRAHVPADMVVRGQAVYSTVAYGLGGFGAAMLGQYVWTQWGSSSAFLMARLAAMVALMVGLKLREVER